MPKLPLTLAPLIVALTAAAVVAQDDEPEMLPHDVAPELIPVPADADDGLFVDPSETPEETPEAPEPEADPVDAPDLPMDELTAVDAEVGTYRFAAETAGMLTLLVEAPGARVNFEIQYAQGRALPGADSRRANFDINREAQQIGYSTLAIPIPEAGEYAIVITHTRTQAETINLCGTWIEFEQLGVLPAAIPGNPAVPPPPPPPPPVEEPGEDTPDLSVGEPLGIEIENNLGWARFAADEDGTLVVAGPDRHRINLSACRDGNFANIDRWSNDQGMLMFRVQADEVWYIKVQGNSDTVQLRSTLIPDDLDEHIPVEEDE